MTTFVLATHNAHKVDELRRILGERLGPHELVGYDGPEPVEDGDTFEANALIKARAAAVHHRPARDRRRLRDLRRRAGRGARHPLGPLCRHARRRRQPPAAAERTCAGVADRAAQFVCAAATSRSDGGSPSSTSSAATGPGSVLEAPAGAGGFGYDPIFRPDGARRSARPSSPPTRRTR